VCALSVLIAQLKVDVQLVNIVATVADEKGRLVAGLNADDFIVEEDEQPQTIIHLSQSIDSPISMGIVLDTSGSMRYKMRAAQLAIDRFIRVVHRDDDIFLMTFAVRTALLSDFTSDRDQLSAALRTGVDVEGGTALYDALYDGLQKVKRGRYQKEALLLVTDGEDNMSMTRFDKTLLNIRESEMLVYCIGIQGTQSFDMMPEGGPGMDSLTGLTRSVRNPSSMINSVDMKVLKAFADASGGKAWQISGETFAKDIDIILDSIATELRSQYSIGYYPSHPAKDGKWHSVRIHLKNPNYYARARKEYLGK
jgi:Ca-activated chloride channel family protein